MSVVVGFQFSGWAAIATDTRATSRDRVWTDGHMKLHDHGPGLWSGTGLSDFVTTVASRCAGPGRDDLRAAVRSTATTLLNKWGQPEYIEMCRLLTTREDDGGVRLIKVEAKDPSTLLSTPGPEGLILLLPGGLTGGSDFPELYNRWLKQIPFTTEDTLKDLAGKVVRYFAGCSQGVSESFTVGLHAPGKRRIYGPYSGL